MGAVVALSALAAGDSGRSTAIDKLPWARFDPIEGLPRF
jgi:hypothetical protein